MKYEIEVNLSETHIIEMSKITLRPYQLSDVDDFMQWACNSEVLECILLQLWIKPNSSREEVVSYFNQVVVNHPWYQAICLDGRAIGFVVLEMQAGKYDFERGRADLSYALGREYWGRGISPTALRIALSSAFHKFTNLVRIQALVGPGNKASERVLQKVGFTKEGVLRQYAVLADGECLDISMYSILSTDPILN
ncbi:uncharacterized protein LOC110697435 [Chenopodium quinoa]|uniref:uncharacterized protein LOC110697435 n=1 Tax=Chenopodium quinoa TaxID=63459 RepID=UPI000B784908|nr:uncharacterized protein LOC110697435 [Chenopodium quinoa]